MICKLKALGLAMIAVLLLSTAVPALTQASETPIFEIDAAGEATLTGEQLETEGHKDHTFELSSGRDFTCNVVQLEGTAVNGTEEIALALTYDECFSNDTQPTTVTTNGCKYRLSGGNQVGSHFFSEATLQLDCPEASELELHVYASHANHTAGTTLCKYKVAPFTNETANAYENTTNATHDVDVTTTVSGVSVKRVSGSALACGAENQTAIYTGATTLRAYKDAAHKEQVDLIVVDPTYEPDVPIFEIDAAGEATLTGEQLETEGHKDHTFELSSGRDFTCNVVQLEGTAVNGTEEIALALTYDECFSNDTQPTTVTTNGCKYRLSGGNQVGSHFFSEATLQLDCPEASELELHVYASHANHTAGTTLCKYKVAPFTNETANAYENTTNATHDVDVTTTVSGVSVKRVSGSALVCGPIEQTAVYTGATTLRAYKDAAHKEQVDLIVVDPTYEPDVPIFEIDAAGEATLTGEQLETEGHKDHTFELSSGRDFTCNVVQLEGTAVNGTEEIALALTYDECFSNDTQPTTVTTNGCKYRLSGGNQVGSHFFSEATLQLDCPEASELELHVYASHANHTAGTTLCKYKVAPFTNETANAYENTTNATHDVDVTTTVSGVSVKRVSGSALVCGPIEQTAVYTGATTLRAYKDAAHKEQVDLIVVDPNP